MKGREALPAVLVVCAFFLLPAPAASQDFTIHVGGLNPGNLDTAPPLKLDGGVVWGFRLSTGVIPQLGIEHTVAFSSDVLSPKGQGAAAESKGFIYNSNLIVNLPVGNTVPYVTAGLGLIRQYGSPNLPVGTRFAFNYGGGVKIQRLSGPFGLRIDARGYSATGIFSKNLNMLEVSGGLLISF